MKENTKKTDLENGEEIAKFKIMARFQKKMFLTGAIVTPPIFWYVGSQQDVDLMTTVFVGASTVMCAMGYAYTHWLSSRLDRSPSPKDMGRCRSFFSVFKYPKYVEKQLAEIQKGGGSL